MSNPYADTADAYWNAGWRGVLPLPHRRKKLPPTGYTGSTGTDPAYPDVATWMQDGDRNICLRLPAHVIGIDVDAYGDKAGAFTLREREAEWGQLPPTWRSTSRDDGISGIRLYRIPVGLAWPGEVGPGIETVRRDHRYVVCAPSVHPDTGDTYRWIDPDGIVAAHGVPDPDRLPFLPDAWVEGLTGGEMAKEVRRNSLATDAAMLWVAQRPDASGVPCKRMDTACSASIADLRDHSAHQSALAGVARLLRLADEGHSGVVPCIVRLREAFIAEVTRHERIILEKHRRSESEATREWSDMLVSGVNFVSADPANLPVCDCDGLLTESIVAAANPEPATAVAETAEPDEPRSKFPQMVDGATFILNAPEQPPAVWGYGESVVWSEGESLTIVGPPGVGKTTLGGQVVKARIKGGAVLGYGVSPTSSKVLYLAMDRPAQIARSLRRHFTEDDREILAERLVVWKGPPPADVAKNTSVLVSLCKLAGADTLVVDSIKDAAIGLSNDEVGAAYNQARQLVLAAGIQVMELHHMVKRGPNGSKPTQLADVYGSTWITSGAGSVLLIWGQPGDEVVELLHLKQPANDIGPLMVEHDHANGTSQVWHGENGEHSPLESLLLANRTNGLTAAQAAAHLFHTDSPDANQKKKATRQLESLVAEGKARKESGGRESGRAAVWHAPNPVHNPGQGWTSGVDRGGHGVDMEGGHNLDRGGHSPTTGVDRGGHADLDTPTPSLEGGLGSVYPPADVHPCEVCGKDTGSAGFIICSKCERERRQV